MAADAKHNLKNTAVKRILLELKELQDNPSDDFMSLPLEGDILDWQFAIRGPSDTEFEGGIYHGMIQLPSDQMVVLSRRYLTVQTALAAVRAFMPVQTALVALRAFMPTEPGRALGSLDHTKEERRALAIKSREAAPIHQYMLCKALPIPELPSQMPEKQSDNRQEEASKSNNQHAGALAEVGELAPVPEENDRIVEDVRKVNVNADAGPLRFRISIKVRQRRRVHVNPDEQLHQPGGRRLGVFVDRILTLHQHGTRQLSALADRVLTFAAIGLTLAIAVLVVKKLL